MVIKVKYNGEWVKIPYLSVNEDSGVNYVEEAPKDGNQYTRKDGVWTVLNIPDDITETINNKVDKVDGKDLSTNDYTNADKTKVDNLTSVLVDADIAQTEFAATITLDKIDLSTGTTSDVEIELPASTTVLSGLMTAADKTKLNSIAVGAEVNVNADWNSTGGDSQILNKPDLTKPNNLPTWVFDAVNLNTEEGDDYITVHSTRKNLETGETSEIGSTIYVASSEHIGYMSPSDKTKLDELAANAITSTEVDQKINSAIASVYKIKGTVANYEALPTTDVTIGDVYNLEDTGANYVATSTTPTWDKLSETVDLSAYSTTAQNDAKYQPKGNYLTSIPSEYVTDTELNSKGYLTDATSDGKLYGRKDGVWSEVQNESDIVTIDFLKLYGLQPLDQETLTALENALQNNNKIVCVASQSGLILPASIGKSGSLYNIVLSLGEQVMAWDIDSNTGEPTRNPSSNFTLAKINEVLVKENDDEYTPTNDYNPATKKYVDDAVAGAGGDNVYYIDYLFDNNGELVESITDEQYNELKEHINNNSVINIEYSHHEQESTLLAKQYLTCTSVTYYMEAIALYFFASDASSIENTKAIYLLINIDSPHTVTIEDELDFNTFAITKQKVEEVLTGNIESHSHDTTYVEVEDTYGTDIWDGSTISTELSGSGTKDDPYLIQSCADWLYLYTNNLIDAVGADRWIGEILLNFVPHTYIKLVKNLNFNNKTIPNPKDVFTAEIMTTLVDFDGNNLTISNFKMPNIQVSSTVYAAGVFPTCTFSYVHNFNLENVQITVDVNNKNPIELFMHGGVSISYCYCFNNYIDFTLTVEGEITENVDNGVYCGCGSVLDTQLYASSLQNSYYNNNYKETYSGISATIQDNTTKSNGAVLNISVLDTISNCKTCYYDISSNAISVDIGNVVFPEDSTFNSAFGMQTVSKNTPKIYFNTDKASVCFSVISDPYDEAVTVIDTIGKTETELESSTFVDELNSNLSKPVFKYNSSSIPTIGTYEINYNGYVKQDEFDSTIKLLNENVNNLFEKDFFRINKNVYNLETTDSAAQIASAFVDYYYVELMMEAQESGKIFFISESSNIVNNISFNHGSIDGNEYITIMLHFNYTSYAGSHSQILCTKYIKCRIYKNLTSTGVNYDEGNTWIKQYYLGGYELRTGILNLTALSPSSTISSAIGGVNEFKKIFKLAQDGNRFFFNTSVSNTYACNQATINLVHNDDEAMTLSFNVALFDTTEGNYTFAVYTIAYTIENSTFACVKFSTPALTSN